MVGLKYNNADNRFFRKLEGPESGCITMRPIQKCWEVDDFDFTLIL